MAEPRLRTTRPTQPQATASGQRGLKHPPDKTGDFLDTLSRNSRGVNTADPAIEDPSVTFPASTQVDRYRTDGRARLVQGEGGTGKGAA